MTNLIARIETSYRPGSSRSRGNAYEPFASVTTVTVLFDPSRLARTSTPSIAPSSGDRTVPESPIVGGPCARSSGAAAVKATATTRAVTRDAVAMKDPVRIRVLIGVGGQFERTLPTGHHLVSIRRPATHTECICRVFLM